MFFLPSLNQLPAQTVTIEILQQYMSTKNAGLLRDLREKLSQLRKKEELLRQYFDDTKGHAYKRDPQLDKVAAAIRAVESEILILDPPVELAAIRQQVNSSTNRSMLLNPNGESVTAAARERLKKLSVDGIIGLLTSIVAQYDFLKSDWEGTMDDNDEAMMATTYKDKVNNSPQVAAGLQEDCNFFVWAVTSYCDSSVARSALLLPKLPLAWVEPILRFSPPELFHHLALEETRRLLFRAIDGGDAWMLHVLANRIDGAMLQAALGVPLNAIMFAQQVNDETEAKGLVRRVKSLFTNGWTDSVRAIYLNRDVSKFLWCANDIPVEISPERHHPTIGGGTPQKPLAKRSPALPAAKRGKAAVPLRPTTAFTTAKEVETLRVEQQSKLDLFSVVHDICPHRHSAFNRLPEKVVHHIVALVAKHRRAQRQRVGNDDVQPIMNIPTSVLLATGTPASQTRGSSLLGDEHSLDVLMNPLWMRAALKSIVKQRHQECTEDVDRLPEEKYWTYFLDELESIWTEKQDEHVASAFILGGGNLTSLLAGSPVALPSLREMQTSAQYGGGEFGMSTSEASTNYDDVSIPSLPRCALFPQTVTDYFVSTESTIRSIAKAKERNIVASGGPEGTTLDTRTKFNVRTDAPVLHGRYCYRVVVPVHLDASSSTRIGWAKRSFPLGLVDQFASPSLGDSDDSYGATFIFEEVDDEPSETTSPQFSSATSSPRQFGTASLRANFGTNCVSVAVPTPTNEPQEYVTFRVHIAQWCCGRKESHGAEDLVVTVDINTAANGTSPRETDEDNGGSGDDAKHEAGTVEIIAILDTVEGEISFIVGGQQLPPLWKSSSLCVSSVCPGSDDGWFPAATVGIASNRPSSPNSAGKGCRSQASPSPQHKSRRGQSSSTVAAPFLWAFDFQYETDTYSAIQVDHRHVDLLLQLNDYTNAVIGLHRRLRLEPRVSNDTAALRVREFLGEYIHTELQAQWNRFDMIPFVLQPRILDIDDVFDILLSKENVNVVLRRMKLSDKGMMAITSLDHNPERDARWFPALKKPKSRSRSRFGSIRAMEKTIASEHWKVLMFEHRQLRTPPLCAALSLELIDCAYILLRSAAVNVDLQDSSGNTALMLAVLFGHPHIVQILLFERKADLSLQNGFGLSALHIALVNNQKECLNVIQSYLVSPTATAHGIRVKDLLDALTRGKSNSLAIAVKLAQYELAEAFLSMGASPCLADNSGCTPLIFALRHADLRMTRLLLAHRHLISRDQLNVREKADPKGSALLYAVNVGEPEIVEILLQMGADVSALFSKPKCSALHAAVVSGSLDCVKLVIKAMQSKDAVLVNVNGFDDGTTALHLAVSRGENDIAMCLLHSNADVNAVNVDGRTPLMLHLLTPFYTDKSALSFFHAAKKKIRADITDRLGRSVLFYALEKGNIDIVNLLIESCRCGVNNIDHCGYTPLTYALAHNQEAAAECLINAASLKINLMIARPGVPQPIEFAYRRNCIRICRMIIELGERCPADLKPKIEAAEVERERRKQAGAPMALDLEDVPLIALSAIPRDVPNEWNGGTGAVLAVRVIPIPNLPIPLGGSAATSILTWHARRAGDPQHRRLSASCFGPAATVRPSQPERVAQRLLDCTRSGDEAIEVLKTLEAVDLAVLRRGESTSHSPSVTPRGLVSPQSTKDVIDLDSVVSDRYLTSSMPRDDIVRSLIELFSEFIPEVNDAKKLCQWSTQVLMLLVEARSNAARHAFAPLTTGGYEMSIRRFEALAIQALQLNRESSVVVELETIVKRARDAGAEFDVNVITRSKWRGRNVTPLHIAVLSSNAAAVQFLIEHGADAFCEPNDCPPVPLADLEMLWRSTALNVSLGAITGPYVRIPSALLCALRLGQQSVVMQFVEARVFDKKPAIDDICVYISTKKMDSIDEGNTNILLSVPKRRRRTVTIKDDEKECEAQEGDIPWTATLTEECDEKSDRDVQEVIGQKMAKNRSVASFARCAVSLVHLVSVLTPHHDWTSSRDIRKFWSSLHLHFDHINTRDVVTGLTGFQLAVVCGRNDFAQWCLDEHLVDVEENSLVILQIHRIKLLFDTLGTRFVMEKTIAESRGMLLKHEGKDKGHSQRAVYDDSSSSMLLMELMLLCCPSTVVSALNYGFLIPPLRTTATNGGKMQMSPGHEHSSALLTFVDESFRDDDVEPSVYPVSTRLREKSVTMKPLEGDTRSAGSKSPLRASSWTVGPSEQSSSPPTTAPLITHGQSFLHLVATLFAKYLAESTAAVSKGTHSVHHNFLESSVVDANRSLSSNDEVAMACSASVRRSTGGSYHHHRQVEFARYYRRIVLHLFQLFEDEEKQSATATTVPEASIDSSNASPKLSFVGGPNFLSAASVPVTHGSTPYTPYITGVPATPAAMFPPLQKSNEDLTPFVVDCNGQTVLHMIAQTGNYELLKRYLEVAGAKIVDYAKRVTKVSSRAPHAALQAVQQRIVELKAHEVVRRDTWEKTVLDYLLCPAITPLWFKAILAVLEWLPNTSKQKVSFVEQLAFRCHPKRFASIALATGILNPAPAENGSSSFAPVPLPTRGGSMSPTNSRVGTRLGENGRLPTQVHIHAFTTLQREKEDRVASTLQCAATALVWGLIFNAWKGSTSDLNDLARKLSAANVSRSVLCFANPYVCTLALAYSNLAINFSKHMSAVQNVLAREQSKEANGAVVDAALGATSLPTRPSTAVTFPVTTALKATSRPATGKGSVAPGSPVQGPLFPPPSGVIESGPLGLSAAALLSALNAGEKYSFSQHVSSSRQSQIFNTHFSCGEALQWRGRSLSSGVLDLLDNVAQIIWGIFSSFAQEKLPNPQKASYDPASAIVLNDYLRARDFLVFILSCAAHCGMEHILSASRHRTLCAVAAQSDADKSFIVASLHKAPFVMVAACQAKRPNSVYYLIDSGVAPSPELSPGTTVPGDEITPYMDDVLKGFRIRGRNSHDEPTEEVVPKKQMKHAADSAAEILARATRSCLRILAYSRCSLSENTVLVLLSHPELYPINERTAVHEDTLLHLACMNSCSDAMIALSHARQFTASCEKNAFGLRPWEYATTSFSLDNALAKVRQSSTPLSFHAAVAATPDLTDQNNMSLNASTTTSPRRKSGVQVKSVPRKIVATLRDRVFVVEEDICTDLFEFPVPVLKLTLPMAVTVQQATIMLSQQNAQLKKDEVDKIRSQSPSKRTNSPNDKRHSNAQQTPTAPRSAFPSSPAIDQTATPLHSKFARECDQQSMTEPQRQLVVLQVLSSILGCGERSISDLVLGNAPVTQALRSEAHRGRQSVVAPLLDESPGTASLAASVNLPVQAKKKSVTIDLISALKGTEDSVSVCIFPMYC